MGNWRLFIAEPFLSPTKADPFLLLWDGSKAIKFYSLTDNIEVIMAKLVVNGAEFSWGQLLGY